MDIKSHYYELRSICLKSENRIVLVLFLCVYISSIWIQRNPYGILLNNFFLILFVYPLAQYLDLQNLLPLSYEQQSRFIHRQDIEKYSFRKILVNSMMLVGLLMVINEVMFLFIRGYRYNPNMMRILSVSTRLLLAVVFSKILTRVVYSYFANRQKQFKELLPFMPILIVLAISIPNEMLFLFTKRILWFLDFTIGVNTLRMNSISKILLLNSHLVIYIMIGVSILWKLNEK